MGIPGLMKNLCNRYKKQIIKIKNEVLEDGSITIINEVDQLYFDFNCLIHPICRLIWLTEYKANNLIIDIKEFEQKVILKSIEYLELKIKEINPLSIVGIFIDGVCPMSKIVQQRQRRFASILDKEIMNNIRHKHGVSKDEYYDTNAITPGTEFMETFHKFLLNYVTTHNSNLDSNTTYKFIYSSYKETGEGEHKIIQHIKKQNKISDKHIVIYGLDADLIILSMTLAVNNHKIYLYREIESMNNSLVQPMMYFDVNECAKMIAKDLSNTDIELNDMNNVIPYMVDFVFITLLLGNDFILPNPTLNMRFSTKQLNGYDTLMHVYKSLNNHVATYDFNSKKIKINWNVFRELINGLATYEEQFFINQSNYRNYKKAESTNPADVQIFRMENLMFRFPDSLKMSDKNISYDIRKKRFIHHYFGNTFATCVENNQITYDDKVNIKQKKIKFHSQLLLNSLEIDETYYDNKTITINNNYDKILSTYLGTMSYIMTYYFDECPDYLYYYKFANSPLLSDFYEFLNKTNDNNLNQIMEQFATNKNNKLYITPLMQLMLVLPIKSFDLLPKNVYKLLTGSLNVTDEIKYYLTTYKAYFPKNPKRDFIHKNKLFQASLILDIPNIDLVISLLTSVNVSEEEEARNKLNN